MQAKADESPGKEPEVVQQPPTPPKKKRKSPEKPWKKPKDMPKRVRAPSDSLAWMGIVYLTLSFFLETLHLLTATATQVCSYKDRTFC